MNGKGVYEKPSYRERKSEIHYCYKYLYRGFCTLSSERICNSRGLITVLELRDCFLILKTKGAIIALSVSTGIFIVRFCKNSQTEYLIAAISLVACLIILLALTLKQTENERKMLKESENRYRELFEQFKRYFDLV